MKEHLLEYERMKLRGIITDEEIHRSYEECRTFIDIYGVILDLITIFQLFLSGITIAYLIILTATSEFTAFCRYFIKLAFPTDVFFYAVTFIIFLSIYTFTYAIYQVHWTNRAIFLLMIVVLILLIFTFFFNTLSFPMSIFLKESLTKYGEWFDLLGESSSAYSLIYSRYRTFAIIRMVFLLLTSLICGFSISTYRADIWYIIKTNL